MQTKRIINSLKKASPTILSILATLGMVGTTVMAVRSTPKAIRLIKEDSIKKHGNDLEFTKKEAIISAWRCYIPSLIIGASTIACIFGSNFINKKQKAALIGAYSLISNSYREYKEKVVELYGEETHKKIMESLAVEKAKKIDIRAHSWFSSSSLIDADDDGDEIKLFYDRISDRYFKSTLSRVINAEYNLNRNFVLGGGAYLNNFYDFLGIDPIKEGDVIGWGIDDEFYWIDFDHQLVKLDDGLECYIIEPVYEPVPECEYGYWDSLNKYADSARENNN